MRYLLVIIALLFTSCVNEKEANRVLTQQGYTDIELCGYAWFACGRSDTYSTCFKATNHVGNKIEGVVCSGLLFKNSTIRIK